MRRRTSPPRAAQRGFTLIEVMVALGIFAIAVVGLVALEARSVDAQRSASNIREAERVAQTEMAALQARSFVSLVLEDFAGTPDPTLPHDDSVVAAANRLRDYHRPPADVDPTALTFPVDGAFAVVGGARNKYLVFRQVGVIPNPTNPPANPPTVAGIGQISAATIDVTVLWIDDTNPAFPPPADVTTDELTMAHIDPTSASFAPWVGWVRLRTLRANDNVAPPGP